MRNFSLLALSATLAAQEPPVLITTPPVTSPTFNATALGGGVTEVAQITFIALCGSTPQKWYITATVKTPASAFYTGYTGEATSTGAGAYTIANLTGTELSALPAPTADYFAFNASDDRLVMVFDAGASFPPSVFVRASTAAPYVPFGSIGAPVPAGYRDSQMGDTITPWNGTTGVYEFVYIDGNDLKKVAMTLTAPSTVTLGTPVLIATSGVAKHSPSPMRQTTGLDCGKCRSFIYSQNDSSADSYFRSAWDDTTLIPAPGMRVWDDANWKANPGNIGGSLYWAYAVAVYGNPLQEDVVAMSSVNVPLAGGANAIVCWAPPKATPQAGFVILGALQSPGINLSPIITRGLLGINPAGLVFLPTQVFDPVLGEMSYTLVFPSMPGPRSIDMQVGMFDLVSGSIYLGNNAGVYWR